jgi:hypothetical protein
MATRLSKIVMDTRPLVSWLREGDTIDTFKSLPEGSFSLFMGLLFGESEGRSLEFTPRPVFCSAGITGDDAVFCHFIWTDEIITSALTATRRHFNCHQDILSEPTAA